MKEYESLTTHSLMLEVQIMKKVIVHTHNKQDGSFLSLHFHPRLKQLAASPLNVDVEIQV